MRQVVKMPKVADSVDTVMIVEWHVEVGSRIERGSVLVTVESDKAVIDVPSPVSGTIIEISVQPEDECGTGQAICVVDG